MKINKLIIAAITVIGSTSMYAIYESYSMLVIGVLAINSAVFVWAIYIFTKVNYYIALLKETSDHVDNLKKEIKHIKDSIKINE
jgi:hypothetical protein